MGHRDITIVWVHGAVSLAPSAVRAQVRVVRVTNLEHQWHGPWCFQKVGDAVAKAGYTNKFLSLPSVGSNAPMKHTDEDSDYVRENILKVLDEDKKDVLVVMHSYGGIPGTNASHGLGKEQRKAEGKQTGIVNLAYVTVGALWCL